MTRWTSEYRLYGEDCFRGAPDCDPWSAFAIAAVVLLVIAVLG